MPNREHDTSAMVSSRNQLLGRAEFRLLWPLTILALAAVGLLVAGLVLGAGQVDRSVARHEEYLVRRGIEAQVRQIESSLAGQTVWDEAVLNLDNHFNPAWARANLPVYLRPVIGNWDYLVVDGDDQAIWASRNERPLPPATWGPFADDARLVIAEVRQLELRRGPLPAAPEEASKKVATPIVITRVEARDGRIYMWLASLVQPDFGKAQPRSATSSIVLAGGFITTANMAGVQRLYDLKNVRAVSDVRGVSPEDGRVTFSTIGGGASVGMAWTPQRPGHSLLLSSAWTILGVTISFGALALLMFNRTQTAARNLIATQRIQAEFLANMSHEIRTPLNGVNALSAALARTPLSPEQKAMADSIHGSGVMLQGFLSDILDLARLDADGMPFEAQPFHLKSAVTSVIDLLAEPARARGLDLRLDLAAETDALVVGDAVRLKQILINLLSNAIKFTDHGHVQLSVRPEAAADGATPRWRFEVRDTGIGFDPATKARLFQRFQQGDGAIARRFGGTGLGLAISREMAVRMGGDLEGDGAPGVGAVFTLLIALPPAAAPGSAPASEPPPAVDPPVSGSSLKVLVSEDHPVNRLVIETLLDELGAVVCSTENGREACEAFERDSFDLVLMDMQMPVMDGLTAIRWIRDLELSGARSRTPIIVVTANALPEHQAAALAAGADAFITKPLDADALGRTIETLRPAA